MKGKHLIALGLAAMLLGGCAQPSAPPPVKEEDAVQERADMNALTGMIGHQLVKRGDEIYVYDTEVSSTTVNVILPDGTVSQKKDDTPREQEKELQALKKRDDFVFEPDDCLTYVHGDRIYFYDLKKLYVYENDTFRLVADAESMGVNFLPFDPGFSWLNEPDWYYQSNEDGTVYLCRYSLDEQKMLDKVRVRNVNPVNGEEMDLLSNLVAVGDTVYFLDSDTDLRDSGEVLFTQKICRTDLSSQKTEELFRSDGTIFFQLYNGALYSSVSAWNDEGQQTAGLYRIDPNSGKSERIFDGNPVSFWIFDSDFIYIEDCPDGDFELVRLRTSEGSVQKIELP